MSEFDNRVREYLTQKAAADADYQQYISKTKAAKWNNTMSYLLWRSYWREYELLKARDEQTKRFQQLRIILFLDRDMSTLRRTGNETIY